MYYVYLLRSHKDKRQNYIGSTADLRTRLVAHNAGQSPHTSKFKPWGVICYIAFKTKVQAEKFETYLKAGSGKAFANKHLF
ncbi:MAG: GIY-YIG nuclease family protein [Patescibacteria group bacterium]|jgi:predicted GIY-YIG superfamily endonuclease